MAFEKKEWKDRLVEFAGRRKLSNTSTGESTVVDVERAEGQVSQAGDAFSAANMNDLETRIEGGFAACPTSGVIRRMEVVASLPEDAEQHPDTLYFVTEG